MKYILLIGDGMSDRPLRQLGGKTPLQVAKTPNINKISAGGMLGRLNNYSGKKFGSNSDVCIMSILGYDPAKYYTGRGPLEAAAMGLEVRKNHIVFRCNLVSVDGDKLLDYSAGHISSREAAVLIGELNRLFKNSGVRLFPGVSYRHIAVIDENAPRFGGAELESISCTAPHDAVNMPLEKIFPRGKGAEAVRELMVASGTFLAGHEINYVRGQLDENPANMIWLWGQGRPPNFPPFRARGAVISAVDVVKGIAVCAGLETPAVPGATGYFDTNYAGKAEYALKALEKHDFVLVHLEAPDEAGHQGNLKEKISAIEKFDRLIAGPILKYMASCGSCRVAVLPDHATPLGLKNHAPDPVPFAVCGTGINEKSGLPFDEVSAAKTGVYIKDGHGFLDECLFG